MTIAESRGYVERHYRYKIMEGTFRPFEGCQWAAWVETTHLSERGEKESRFPILVDNQFVFFLHAESVPALGLWCVDDQPGF